MKTFLVLLVLASLIQSAFLPINLCLVLIICRSLVVTDSSNYFLALITGIFIGLLTATNIGLLSLLFILVVKLIYLLKKLPLANNTATVIPLSLIVIVIFTLIQNLVIQQKINYLLQLIEALLCLPTYILIRMWEERFIPRQGVKLKV